MGAFYTFPIEDATNSPQKDPPSLTTAGNETDSDGTTQSATTTEQAALAGEGTTTATNTESASGSMPGFGIPAGVAALLGAGAWRRYRE